MRSAFLSRCHGWHAWLLLALLVPLLPAHAQTPKTRDDAVVARLHAGGVRHERPSVVLWVGPDALPAAEAEAFADALDRGVAEIGELLGTMLDTAHYAEDKVQVFVARGVEASHVYGGYSHMQYDKPYLFLDARRVRRGGAPFMHELTHLMAWRFGSHSLREGFATYVELEVGGRVPGGLSGLFGMTDAATADARARTLLSTEAGARIATLMGRNGIPPADATDPSDMVSRETYYALSQSFVRFMVERIGLATFMRVYSDPDSETAIARLTGISMDVWRERWMRALGGAGTAAKRA